jgi:hypothetical protein
MTTPMTGNQSSLIWVVDPTNNYSTYIEYEGNTNFFDDDAQTLPHIANALFGIASDLSIAPFGHGMSASASEAVGSDKLHHILWAVDFASGKQKIYMDDVDVSPPERQTQFGAPSLVGMSGLPFYVGTDTFGNSHPADLADLFVYQLGSSPFVGDDVPAATRREFIDGNGKPVNPSVAVAALGTPAVLLSGDKDAFSNNQGSGCNFSVVGGALTNADSSPSN